MALLDAVNKWIAAGCVCIPVHNDGSKKPLVTWSAYTHAAPRQRTVERWFSEDAGERGVAVICGAVSGNLEVLDFDDRQIAEEFEVLCLSLGLYVLAECPKVETPSGGCHIYLRCTTPVQGNTKLAMRRDIAAQPETVIETRGERGYVLAPPTVTPSGRYRFLRGRPHTIPLVSVAVLRRLHWAAGYFDEELCPREDHSTPGIHTGLEDVHRLRTGPRPGDSVTAQDAISALLRHGWKPAGQRGTNVLLRRPGKRDGHSATWNGRYFYVFSSNAHPFAPQTAYTAFAVVTMLDHNGDYRAASRAIRHQRRASET